MKRPNANTLNIRFTGARSMLTGKSGFLCCLEFGKLGEEYGGIVFCWSMAELPHSASHDNDNNLVKLINS